PTSAIYPLSLHDALPISEFRSDQVVTSPHDGGRFMSKWMVTIGTLLGLLGSSAIASAEELFQARLTGDQEVPAVEANTTGKFKRSEEHTSELQSRFDLVC